MTTWYIHTEIWYFPEGWEIIEFNKVSSMNGRIWWQWLKQEEFTDNQDDPYLITGMNFKDWNIRWDEVYRIPMPRYLEAKKIQLQNGDVLMTKDGTIWKMLYVDKIPYPWKASLNSHLLVFRPVKKSYHSKFLFYQLQDKPFLKHIELTKTWTTFFWITQESVGKYKWYFPPFDEQKKIASALTNIDDLINSLEKLINKKEFIKKWAMQELFKGDKRLSWFHWEILHITLGEVCNIEKGTLITSSSKRPWNIPVIAWWKKPAYYHDESNRKRNTITISASWANAWYVSFHNYPIFASDCSTISESDQYEVLFIYYYLLLNQNNIYKSQTWWAQPHVHASDLIPFKISIPKDIKEQIAISKVLSDMDSEIDVLKQKRDKYKKIKEWMMQELLTGRIRLV